LGHQLGLGGVDVDDLLLAAGGVVLVLAFVGGFVETLLQGQWRWAMEVGE
jgi:hypothetical protein